jgi:membrane protease YdiL (CAAX protease family)
VALALACVAAAAVTLGARFVPDGAGRIAYSLAVASIFGVLTPLLRSRPSLRRYRELSFAFFVLALVLLLNNSLPGYVRANVLRERTLPGNPQGSTVFGTVVITLVEAAITIVPIVALALASGRTLDSIYARAGSIGIRLALAILAFAAFYAAATALPHSRLLPAANITHARLVALTPALLVVALANGFQEELLFRGLFLRTYGALFGAPAANLLQAAIFAMAHLTTTYTPSAVIFSLVVAFPLGLICGYLMRATRGILAPGIFHAGADIPIYLAFLAVAA